MQMVKIRIIDGEKRADALLALMRRGRVVCFPDNVFIVPEPGLALLQGMGVSFEELGRGGIDYAEKGAMRFCYHSGITMGVPWRPRGSIRPGRI